jgi:hypothetical protein
MKNVQNVCTYAFYLASEVREVAVDLALTRGDASE